MEFEPLESPERLPEPITRPDIMIPDARSLPELEVSRPEPRDFGNTGRKIESAAPRTVNDSTAEARPDINLPSLSSIKRTVRESGLKDVSVKRTPNRGSVDKIAPDFNATRQLAKIGKTVDPTSFLERGVTDEPIKRRTAPAPSTLQEKDGRNSCRELDQRIGQWRSDNSKIQPPANKNSENGRTWRHRAVSPGPDSASENSAAVAGRRRSQRTAEPVPDRRSAAERNSAEL